MKKKLKSRIKKYVDDYLRFLTNFRIDFTYNLAESGLREIKMLRAFSIKGELYFFNKNY